MDLPTSTSPWRNASTPSVSNAARNARSFFARTCTVSLNERVSAMITFLVYALCNLPIVLARLHRSYGLRHRHHTFSLLQMQQLGHFPIDLDHALSCIFRQRE